MFALKLFKLFKITQIKLLVDYHEVNVQSTKYKFCNDKLQCMNEVKNYNNKLISICKSSLMTQAVKNLVAGFAGVVVQWLRRPSD